MLGGFGQRRAEEEQASREAVELRLAQTQAAEQRTREELSADIVRAQVRFNSILIQF